MTNKTDLSFDVKNQVPVKFINQGAFVATSPITYWSAILFMDHLRNIEYLGLFQGNEWIWTNPDEF